MATSLSAILNKSGQNILFNLSPVSSFKETFIGSSLNKIFPTEFSAFICEEITDIILVDPTDIVFDNILISDFLEDEYQWPTTVDGLILILPSSACFSSTNQNNYLFGKICGMISGHIAHLMPKSEIQLSYSTALALKKIVFNNALYKSEFSKNSFLDGLYTQMKLFWFGNASYIVSGDFFSDDFLISFLRSLDSSFEEGVNFLPTLICLLRSDCRSIDSITMCFSKTIEKVLVN